MNRKNLVLFSAFLVAGVPAALGQSNRIERMDRNGDGVVTRSEWRGNLRNFDQQDWNRDGVLSGEELYDNGRNANREQTRSRAADRLDKNNNGVIEGYEWPYNSRVFHDLDTDGDSVLSQDELRNINSATLPQLDTNHNGRIDESEWPGGFAQFDRLDQDNNGRVSSREYFERGGEWQRRHRFDDWDRNRDGVIESTEWKSNARLFRQLDRNGDSRLDWDEFMASTERYDRPYGWR